jgi:hypothetical protein
MFHSETPRIVSSKFLFKQACYEKTGVIERAAYVPVRSMETVLWIAERIFTVRNFLPSEAPLAPITDLNNFLCLIDDVGIILAAPFDKETAHIHMTFWDRRLRGRETLCSRVASYICRVTGLSLMTAIPTSHRAVLEFVKRAGFTESHRVRGAAVLWYGLKQGV